MKLNKIYIIGIILLILISIGTASAVSDNTTVDEAVEVTEELETSTSDIDEINTDSDNNVAISENTNDNTLSASDENKKLSAGTVNPNYTVTVTPNTMSSSTYVAQYGQIITVSGIVENATGNVSIRFGFTGNYYYHNVTLDEHGKFSCNLADYDRVRNNFQIQVTYLGNDYYKSTTILSKNIHIQMNNVTANGGFYGSKPYIDVNLFNATGNVNFTLNGNNYTAKLEKGEVHYEFTNYTPGKNTVTMKYEGDGKIKPIEKDFTFTIDTNVSAPTIYNYQQANVTVYLGNATGKVNFTFNNKTKEVEINNGTATTELENYSIGANTFEISYSGDETYNPFKINETLTVLAKENATIISSVYKTSKQNFIFINIPYATGTINVTVNGKEEEWKLVNGTVKKDINATENITELKVSYGGNVRLNPTNSSFYVNLTDYIVNNKTFLHYFDVSNGGRLYDFLEDGITLDFQGKVYVNTNSSNEMDIIISKPINIISSTKDAYIDLNCTAGSLLGEHPGSSFVVGREGSGSNISGIYLHNTELWISNTTNVMFDNISVVVEDQRVGSGVGATSVRDNSSYVTIKNSYFYTRNNGGSTTFTFAWANHCVFDNNTVKAEGNVGNLLYLNVYNINNLPGPTKGTGSNIVPAYPLNNYNSFINNKVYGKEGSSISVGIMVEGTYNLIANNTMHKSSISTSFGGTGAANNTYYGNILEEGSSLAAQANSIIYNNTVPGTLTTGANSIAYNNTCGGLSTGQNATVHHNNVNKTGTITVSGAGSKIYNNNITTGTITVSGAGVELHDNNITGNTKITSKNLVIHDNIFTGNCELNGDNFTFRGNIVNGTITISGSNSTFINNTVNSTTDYAITIDSKVNYTNVTNNILYSDKKCGDDAVSFDSNTCIIKDNTPSITDPNLIISADNINVGEEITIKVATNNTFSGNVTVTITKGSQTITTFNITVTNGTGEKKYSNLGAGNYTLEAVFSATPDFKKSTANTTINVNKYNININVTVDGTVYVGNSFTVKVSTNNSFSGNMTVIVNNTNYTVKVVNGEGSVIVEAFTAPGQYPIKASFGGNDRYDSKNATGTVTVIEKPAKKYDLNLIVSVGDVTLGDNINVKITTNTTFTGNVTVRFNGKDYNVTVTNGTGIINTLKPEVAGKYDVIVIFNGNDNFNTSSKSASAYACVNPILTVTAANTIYSKPIMITVKDSGNPFNGQVSVLIDGKVGKLVTVSNGVGTITLTASEAKSLGAGKHGLTVTSAQTETSYAGSASTLFNINNLIKLSLNKVKVKKSAKKLVLKALLKINFATKEGVKITFKFNGKKYTAKTNKKGVAKVTIKKSVLKKLKVGKKVTYQATYSGETVKYNIKVKK